MKKIIKIPQTCCIINPAVNWNSFKNEKDLDFWCLRADIRKNIITLIEEYSVKYFMSGMSRGLELVAAEIIISLKKKYNLTFEGVFPYEEQAARWPVKYHEKYYNIMSQSDKETMTRVYYEYGCYRTRNDYMKNNSNYLLTGDNKDIIIKEKNYLDKQFTPIINCS